MKDVLTGRKLQDDLTIQFTLRSVVNILNTGTAVPELSLSDESLDSIILPLCKFACMG